MTATSPYRPTASSPSATGASCATRQCGQDPAPNIYDNRRCGVNILTTYTLKYLRLNRKRTAVTILGVILSAALICGVFLLGVSFQKVMIDHEIFMAGNWHARFHAVPYEKAKYITENSAVQTAMLNASLGSATDGSHNTVRPYLYVTAYDALSFQNHSIQLISGRVPQKEDELLISPVMIRDSGLSLNPGSTIDLAFGQRNI